MSLTKGGAWPSWDPRFRTTADNDNPLLYLTEYLWLAKTLSFEQWVFASTNTWAGSPGLYHRNPGRADYITSHDEYVARAAGCIFFGDTKAFAAEILPLFPIINNVNPGRVNLVSWSQPSGIHPPNAWFLYYLAGGEDPAWPLCAAFVAGLAWCQFKAQPFHTTWLNWLMCEATLKRLPQSARKARWVRQAAQDYLRYAFQSGAMAEACLYFSADHPNRARMEERLGQERTSGSKKRT